MRGQFFLLLLLPLFSFSQRIVADFSATPLAGCPPMVVNFTDLSTGGPNSWRWEFGNGSTSTQQNPGITYFLPGSYSVKLVVRNASNTDSVTKTQYINVTLPPTVSFYAPVTSGCSPLPVQFVDSSIAGFGNIVSWKWDFGDGSSSTLQNPLHVYRGSGTFTVTLWATNSVGCTKIFTRPAYIRLLATPSTAFSYSISQGCSPPATVTFINTTTSILPVDYLWDFGDGNTSQIKNPVHSYPNPGAYTVKLIATNNNGCSDTLIKLNTIRVQFAQANFTVPAGACAGRPVTLANTSLPGSISARWEFGDGSTSTAINPVKTFANPGTYQIKLVNNFGSCLDSITKTITVTSKPVPDFTATNNFSCKSPLTVAFTNNSTGSVNYTWNFGDGTTSASANPVHTYTQAGNFTVTLTAVNVSGCQDSLVKTNFVRINSPKITSFATLPASGCLPYTITPSAVLEAADSVVSYFWDFGDGNTSTAANPSNTYTTAGLFTVKLIITTSSGCTDTLVKLNSVNVGSKPNAAFSATPLNVCAKVPINFTDESTGNATQWLWTFGDGVMSTLQNPIHYFSDTGFQGVTLVVYNYGCTDTITKLDYIYVIPPVAGFDTSFSCKDRLTRTFIDESISAQTWQWDFGDGTSSTQTGPTHTYAAPGDYSVQLTVTNGACTHLVVKSVKVLKEQGKLAVNAYELCRGNAAGFNVNNINPANITDYAWHFTGLGASDSLHTSSIPVNYTYHLNGTYMPAVVITDSLKCTDTLMLDKPVKVYGPTAGFMAIPAGVCFSTPVVFADSSLTDGEHALVQWTWNYGDTNIQSYTSPPFQHTYTATGLFGVSLTVKDSFGCLDSISKPNILTVSRSGAQFTSSDSLTCPGASVNFTNLTADSNLMYLWNFGDGGTSTVQSPVHSYVNPGKYTVKLRVTSPGGCIDSLVKTNYITVDKPVARFAVSDSFICQPIQILFTDSSHYATSWSWEFDNGNTSVLQNPVNVFSTSRMYRVKLVATAPGGCQDSAYKVINVDLLSATLSYSPLIGCAPAPVTFVAHSSRKADYLWNFGDGNSVTTQDSVVVNTYNAGGYFLPQILLIDVRGCVVPVNGNDTIAIEKLIPKVTSDLREVCDSGFVQFTDSTLSLGTLSYKWFFGDGATSTLKNPLHYYTRSGNYTVKLVVASSLSGCVDSIVYNNFITVSTTVTPSLTISVSDTVVCAGKPLTFVAHPVKSGQKPFFQWKVNGTNRGTNSDTLTINTLANGDIVSCVVASELKCVTNPSALSNSIKITVNPNVTPAITISVSASSICLNTSARFTAVAVNGGASPRFQWKVNGRNVAANSNTYTTTTLSNGDVVTCMITSSETCTTSPTAESDGIRMTVYAYPQVNAGPDQVVLFGWRGMLNPVVSATEAKFRWSPPVYLSNDSTLRPVSAPQADINYKLTVTGIGGCTSSDDVFIKVLKLYIPNAFSPNGDGINDTWIINNLQFFPAASVDIFNRYGQLLFHSNGYEYPWNGTYKGSPLPFGVYYYVIELKDQGIKPIGGSVTILK